MCRSVNKRLSSIFRTQHVCRRRTKCTFSTETRGFVINHNYSNTSNKYSTLWHNYVHPFPRLIIHIHLTRVQEYLFPCKGTGATFAATPKAGFGTDSRRSYRIVKLWNCREDQSKQGSKQKRNKQ